MNVFPSPTLLYFPLWRRGTRHEVEAEGFASLPPHLGLGISRPNLQVAILNHFYFNYYILSYLTFIHKLRFITPQTRWCQLPKCSCRNPAFFLSSPVELCCLYLTPICVSITIYTSVTSVEINLQGAIQKIIWYVCIGFFFI